MNNYYIEKKERLLDEGYSLKEAILELYHVYLDKKYKKLSLLDNNKQFWDEFIWVNLKELNIDEVFVLCLVKAFNEKYSFSTEYIETLYSLDEKLLLQVVKKSKVFLELNNTNFETIESYYFQRNISVDFFKSCKILYDQKLLIEKEIQSKLQLLKEFGYLDLICAISLYMMKNVNENKNPSIYQRNGDILTKILLDRLRIKDKRKKPHDDESMRRVYKIIEPKNSYLELDRLERIFESYRKMYEFEENILTTFCFDENFKYVVKDNLLELNVINHDKYRDWFNNGEKINILFEYFSEEALKSSIDFMSKNTFGYPENDDINKLVHINTSETHILMKNLYGLSEDVAISEDVNIPLFESIHSINNLRGLYLKYFLPIYSNFLDEKGCWIKAWKSFYFHGMTIGKNRSPLIYQKEFQFAKNMLGYDEIITEEDKKNIEAFFTFDLRQAHSNKEEKIPNLFEKPLLKIDDYVLIMPFVLGAQNSSTPFINNLLNIHFKRTKFRKDEVHESEKRLSEYFVRNGFNVEIGYMLPDSEKYQVGDIDLICEKEGYLFILELKSTYIRTTMENIENYKTHVLRKASNQLTKRKRLIDRLIKNNDKRFKFLEKEPKEIYYWTVDTSFEYDHELINNNLKVSMFELMYVLNNKNEKFYPSGFNVKKFIELIESGSMWDEFINKDIIFSENINYKVSF